MPRRRKPSGKPYRGPFDAADIEAALQKLGGTPGVNGKHVNYDMPGGGKASVSRTWTGIKAGGDVFNSLARQAGVDPKALLAALNEVTGRA